MNSLEANTRNTKSKGDIRSLRLNGNVPGIVYGGTEQNEKVKKAKNIEVLPISNLMGEAIKRISNSTSVSDLFK